MTFWDFCAPFYDFAQHQNSAYKKMVEFVVGIVPQGTEVLEVAAGTGDISLAISAKAKSVLCTDVSERMLKIARKKAAKCDAINIAFDNISIFDTGKANGEYDVVVASQVLHLIDEPKRAAEELIRVSSELVVLPLALIKNLKAVSKFKVSVWRLFGFNPKHNFDAEGYEEFLNSIGFEGCKVELIDGDMPMAVAVWRKSASRESHNRREEVCTTNYQGKGF